MAPSKTWELQTPMSRAAFLRGAAGTTMSVSTLGLLAACGDDDSESSTEAGGEVSGELRFLGWQGYDDKAAVRPLTAQGVDLSAQYITANDDIVTKLRGGTTLDVVTPFIAYMPALIASDLVQELDYSRLTSANEYYPELVDIIKEYGDGKTYGAPIVWGDIPMIVRPSLMPEMPKSYLDLRDPQYKGTLITLDDAYQNIVLMSRAVNGPDNASEMTPDQLEAVVSVWKEIKPNLVAFAPSFGDAADILARGDAGGAIVGWRFMQQELLDQNIEAEAYVPEEGTFAWLDSYAIPTNAPNPDAAYEFINTMGSPRGNALMGEATGSAVSNEEALANLSSSARNLYPYDDMASYFSAQYPLPLEPEGDIVSYDDWLDAWEEIKAA